MIESNYISLKLNAVIWAQPNDIWGGVGGEAENILAIMIEKFVGLS